LKKTLEEIWSLDLTHFDAMVGVKETQRRAGR